MKKLALFLALMLIPCSAFGLEMLTDNAMDEVTGQAGVSIGFDDIEIFMNVDRFSYIDCDGLSTGVWGTSCGSTTDDGAAINVNGFQMDTIKLNAIVYSTVVTKGSFTYTDLHSLRCGDIALQYDYTDSSQAGCRTSGYTATAGMDNFTGHPGFKPQAISIDVTDSCPALSEGKQFLIGGSASLGGSIRIAGIVITLPTFEAYIDQIQIESITITDDVVPNNNGFNNALNDGKSLGAFEIEGVTFTLLSGWIEIAPH
jgi:hypothetical protein